MMSNRLWRLTCTCPFVTLFSKRIDLAADLTKVDMAYSVDDASTFPFIDTLDVDFLEYLFDILARLKDNFVQSFPVKKVNLTRVW